MDKNTYNQPIKNKVRHKVVKLAVNNLTLNRNNAAVIPKNYVRNIYDHFINLDESSSTINEVNTIDQKYISDWEKLHDSIVSFKRPDELQVCYLCGPEPSNDFDELINLGVLPQNIWAFEIDEKTYTTALSTFSESTYPQPKILKQKIDNFFEFTPKKFDIAYIDACGAIPSSQHALKSVRKLFESVRLSSPGILITNFSTPDNDQDIEDYVEVLSLYLYFREAIANKLTVCSGEIINSEYKEFQNKVRSNFEFYYSKFISMVLRDLPSVLIPLQRIKSNPYLKKIFITFKQSNDYDHLFSLANNNGLAKFIFSVKYLQDNKMMTPKLTQFIDEIGNLELLKFGFEFILSLHNGNVTLLRDFERISAIFNSGKLHQFLDKAHINMFYDTVIYQLTYPMHYNNKQNYRCYYKAKEKKMMLEVTTYDECRYLYDFVPTIDQMCFCLLNKSWQYIYRFTLDGLVKSRLCYNNELFFQGSVISERISGFESIKVPDRIDLIGG